MLVHVREVSVELGLGALPTAALFNRDNAPLPATADLVERARKLQVAEVHCRSSHLTAPVVEAVTQAGFKVMVRRRPPARARPPARPPESLNAGVQAWFAGADRETPEQLSTCVKIGCHSICTNQPELLREVLGHPKPAPATEHMAAEAPSA